MTFAEYEESRSFGEPDVLYRFTYGDEILGYTDAEDPVVFGGVTYQAIPIDRGSVNTSGTLDKSELSVRVPRDTPIAELFRVFPPSEVVALTIFQGHATDEDMQYLAIWAGRVLSCKWEDSEAVLQCEPVNTSMRRAGLRIRDQYQCMHALYGPACRVDRAAFTTIGTVTARSGAWLSLAAGWNGSIPKGRFANGILKWGTEQRQILSVDEPGDRLRIESSLRDLAVGMQVEVSRGCSHNLDQCGEFGNVLNFGGCNWIPKKNPIGQLNTFF